MFTKTAAFYDAIYAQLGKDYAREADRVLALATEISGRPPRTLLDAGAGTGAHLAAFAARGVQVRGFDLQPELVTIARSRVEAEIDVHDLVDVDLGEQFDCVTALFGTLAYVRTRERLITAVAALRRHVAPGGALIVEGFILHRDYRPGMLSAVFVDESDLKIARMSLSKQTGKIGIIDFNYLVGTLQGIERHFERHELGLFTNDDYRDAFAAAGLEMRIVPEETDVPFAMRTIYAARG